MVDLLCTGQPCCDTSSRREKRLMGKQRKLKKAQKLIKMIKLRNVEKLQDLQGETSR